MAQYFVHEGLQFQVTKARADSFLGSSRDGVDAVRLEDVVTAVSPTASATAIIPGANAAAQLSTLIGWWQPSGTTDSYLTLQRELIDNVAEVLPPARPGFGPDAAITGMYHALSHQYILPVGLSDAIAPPPGSATPATAKTSADRVVLKSLEVRHDNIKRHDTAQQAWEAWIAFTITKDSTDETTLARSGYLITP